MAKVFLRAGKAGIALLLVLLVAGVIFYSGHVFTFGQDDEVLPESGVTEIQSQSESDYAHADTLFKSQDFADAKILYDSVAQNTPDSELAMKSLARAGRCEIRLGNITAADQLFDKLTKDYSTQPKLYENVCYFANSYWNSGDYDIAMNAYQLVYDSSTDADLAFKGLEQIAFCQIRLSDYATAENTITEVLSNYSQNPNFHAAIAGFGYQYQCQKKYEKAKELFQFVIQNSSDIESAFNAQLGVMQCEIKLRNYLDALAAFEELYTNHSSAKAFVEKATRVCDNIMRFDGPENVLPYIDRAIEVTNDAKTAAKLLQFKAQCHIDLGESEQAQAIRQIIELYSDQEYYPGVQLSIAYRYRKNGEYVKATEIYSKVLLNSTDEAKKLNARVGLAAISAWLDEDSNVTAAVESLCNDFTDHKKLGHSILVIGEEYYKKAHASDDKSDKEIKGYHRKAISIWKKCINEIPDPDHKCLAYYFTGLSYQSLRNYPKSIANYHKALNGFPDNEHASKALFMIGRLYQKNQVTGRTLYPAFLPENENISDPNETTYAVSSLPVSEMADPNSPTIVSPKINNVYVNSTREAYELLLERYPASPGAAYARQWLMKQGSN